MYCGNCGANLSEGSVFCPACGSKVTGEGPEFSFGSKAPEKKTGGNYRMIGIVVVAVLAVFVAVIGVLVFGIFGGRSEEKVVKSYVEGSFKPDAELILSLMPKQVRDKAVEELEKEEYLWGEEEVADYLNEQLQSYIDQVDAQLGDGWNYSYEIVEEEDYDQSRLRNLKVQYREMGVEEFTADAAKEIKVEIAVESADKETSVTRNLYVTVVKIGRSWYLDASSL